jgi:hypothetical protein
MFLILHIPASFYDRSNRFSCNSNYVDCNVCVTEIICNRKVKLPVPVAARSKA